MKRAFADYLIETKRITAHAIDSLPHGDWGSREPIGRLALLHNLLSPTDIDKILNQQKNKGEYFGQIAIRLGLLTTAQLQLLLAGQSVRSCLELMEDLVLAGQMDLTEGLAALSEFVAQAGFDHSVPTETATSF